MPDDDVKALLSGNGPMARCRVRTLLEALPEEGREALAAISDVVEVKAGECVLAEGKRSEELGYLLDGALAMQKTLADGRLHIIGILVPTDMFGRLFNGGSAYDIVALTDCRILSFRRNPFEDILGQHQEIERMFLVSVLDELDSAREWVLLMGARRIRERVASFLLILLRRKLREMPVKGERVDPLTIRIPLRRRDLAHYLGTTSETISRTLHELEADRIVRLLDAYEIEILDTPALVRISGDDHLVSSVA